MRGSANPQIHRDTHTERSIVPGMEAFDRIVGIVLKTHRSLGRRIGTRPQDGCARTPSSVEVNIDFHK